MFKHLHIYRDCKNADLKEIKVFENKFNICLPTIYKEFLVKFGGGRFWEENFDFINKDGRIDGKDAALFCFDKLEKENVYIQNPNY